MGNSTKGNAFLLKVADDTRRPYHTTPPFYSTVAGMRVSRLLVDDGKVEIDANGIFLGSNAESQVRGNALSGNITDYELSFEGGEKMRGKFLVRRLEYTGDFNGERNYALSLESAGEVINA